MYVLNLWRTKQTTTFNSRDKFRCFKLQTYSWMQKSTAYLKALCKFSLRNNYCQNRIPFFVTQKKVKQKSKIMCTNKQTQLFSEIQKIFVWGIQNATLWNPESTELKYWIQYNGSGIHIGIHIMESTSWNPKSKAVTNCLTRGRKEPFQTTNLLRSFSKCWKKWNELFNKKIFSLCFTRNNG